MSLEYAPLGFIGVLTPQANTTVEAEFATLLPAGAGLLAGRLVSAKPDLEARLVDYFDGLEDAVAQFADAPLSAVGFACTGSSYLAGRVREDEVLRMVSERRGVPVTSTGRAVVDALHALDARRIALVSPYSESLTRESVGYWASHGFDVGPVARATGDVAAGAHPIYGLGSHAAVAALNDLRGRGPFDAVVMLGTGLPTLRAILETGEIDGAPVFSCTLALAWRCFVASQGAAPSAASLREWIDGQHWAARHRERRFIAR